MIKIKSKDIFVLPENPHLLHLATLTKGILREFWVMLCISGPHQGKCYIEEYVVTSVDYNKDIYGNFKFVEDDEEAEELARFSELHKLTDISERTGELVECGLGQIVFR